MEGIFPKRNEGRKASWLGGEFDRGVPYVAMGHIRNTARAERLSRLAERQHGVVSRRQLRTLGYSDAEIHHGVESRRLLPVFRGVYAVGHKSAGHHGRLMAAALACEEGAFVSHRSAGALLGLLDRTPNVVDITSPTQRGRKIDGVRCHKVLLRLDETGSVDGIPCTSPARTLVDCAGAVGVRTLRSMFERAAAKRMLDLDAVEASMRPGRRGAPMLRGLVEEWRLAAPVARNARLKSPLEAKVLPLVLRRGVPAPRCNAPVRLIDGRRIEVDFLWPEQRFVLEADSRGFHATEVASERDRWRDRELLRAGYGSLRVTWLQAEREAEAIAETVAAQLRRG